MTARAAPIVGVGVLALRGDGALLIGRRISGPGPLWCLPGGHLEAGEDFERAARRELEEEAGSPPPDRRACSPSRSTPSRARSG